ncbi:MAG: AAA family ATPase [Fimbriimonas sp.]
MLFSARARSFASLAVLPSNVEALEEGLHFTTGRQTFMAITGPSGWGKTHLLEAIAYRLTQTHGQTIHVVGAMDFLANPTRMNSPLPLLVDDVHEPLARRKQQDILRRALERRVRAKRPTVLAFTTPKPTHEIRHLLPNSREWAILNIRAPEPAERLTLIQHLAQEEGLSMANSLLRIMAFQIFGNGNTLVGALKRLRLSGPEWLTARASLRACGLLGPFFTDNPDWDLRAKLHQLSEQSRSMFPLVQSDELAIYALLHIAECCEADVARSFGIEPSEAYTRAGRFMRQASETAVVARYIDQFCEMAISNLAP